MNQELFNQKIFPKWEGYKITDDGVKNLKSLWNNDIDSVCKSFHELFCEMMYYKKMLLYIQTKFALNEPLDLGLDSSKEVLDIMITPLEILKDNGTPLELEDYIQLREFNYVLINNQFQYECLSCSYSNNGYDDFKRHKCDDYKELDEL